MAYADELNNEGEIRGVVCPECGGSLVWRRGRAFCDEDYFVEPVNAEPLPFPQYTESDLQWLRDHANELGDDL